MVGFLLVGVINTGIDFLFFNFFIEVFGLPVIVSNVLSVSIAMAFSFTMNRRLVFKSKGPGIFIQTIKFVAVTAVGIYVIQNVILFVLLSDSPIALPELNDYFDINVRANIAKIIATGATMVWNFVFYKFVVFKEEVNADQIAKEKS